MTSGRDQIVRARLSSGGNRLNGLTASLLAAAAGLCADPAMLMHGRMPLAFLAAGPTCLRARLERRHDHLLVAARPAGGEASGRDTEVRTVEIEADALTQLVDHLLADTGVGAGCAALRA